jgi:hypothetical protein
METLLAYLSVFFVASLIVGIILHRHPFTAILLCPVISFTIFLLLRDWSDFDGPAIWATPGSTSSWVFMLAVYLILHGFPSVIGAGVGIVVGQRLIGRRAAHNPSK